MAKGHFLYKDGDRIGPNKILMIKRTRKSDKGYYYAIFQCPVCGKNFETSINHVTMGRTKTCGCSRDLTGRRYGKLTVIKNTGKKVKSDDHLLWLCRCDCGNYKEVNAGSLTTGLTLSCGCLKSKGEQKVSSILRENNISFNQEETFEDCIDPETNTKLRFDFYLPKHNCCIEYDGIQHFEPSKRFGGEKAYKIRKRKDKLRDKYCEENDILLIRIPYTDYKKVDLNYLIDRGLEIER